MGRFTFAGRAFAWTAGVLLTFGVFGGNDALLAAGALPLLFLAGAASSLPVTSASRTLSGKRVHAMQHVTVKVEVEVPRRRGLLEVHQPLPEPFALADGESNFRVLRTGGRHAGRRTLEFKFEASKRGDYTLPPLTLRWVEPLGLVDHAPVAVTDAAPLEVIPRASHRSLVRDVRSHATRPIPEADHARFGLPTTEFRELRDYVAGDPIKNINWKATARRLSTGHGTQPLVNEYEWEGKKTVWFLMDGSVSLEIGDSVRDAREHAAEAALGLAETFLRRGFQVGASTFRSPETKPLYPDAGDGQIPRIRKLLATLDHADGPTLEEALDRVRAFASARRPLFIVFTRLDRDDDEFFAGLRRARAFHGQRARGTTAVVVDVQPWEGYPAGPGAAAAVAERRAQHAIARRRARATGASVIEWDPGARPFEAVVARRGIA